MESAILNLKNNQACQMSQIPLLEEKFFQARIKEACQGGARLVNLFGLIEENTAIRVLAFLGYDDEDKLLLFSMRLSPDKPFFDSMTPDLLQAHLFEREIAEQFLVQLKGHPWLKPIRKPMTREPGFFRVKGEETHEVAVGPVHVGIIEPGHFRFQCHGEEILNLEIQLGYQHRGIENMMQEVSSERRVWLAESIAGDTVIGHGLAYCGAMESLSDCHVSPRAEALRAVALELERLANHAGDLGALSGDIGFLPAAAYFGRLRGEFLNLLMALTGNRYGRSFCRPGGVLFDMDSKMIDEFRRRLLKAQQEIRELSNLFFTKPSVLGRLENIGIVSSETVKQFGFVGPTARAAGCARDVRMDHAYGMYRFHQIPISLAENGDVYSRAMIRWLESQRSIDFLLELFARMPEGDLLRPPGPLKGRHLALSMVEGWRGEIVHVVVTDSNSKIARYKIKDPSFNNWMALTLAARGMQISDFPLCNKSFNLSYAGHDL